MSIIDDAILFRFEDTADATDISGNTVSGNPQPSLGYDYVPGHVGTGKAISFTHADGHIPLANSSELLELGANFSIAGWIYIPDPHIRSTPENAADHSILFSNADSYGNWTSIAGLFFSVCNSPSGVPEMALPGRSVHLFTGAGAYVPTYAWAWTSFSTPQDSFPFNQWVHISVVVEGADTHSWLPKVYINGQQQTLIQRSNQPAIKPFTWSSDENCVQIGGVNRVSDPDNGTQVGSGECKFDEIGIWKRGLSELEIQSLYNMDYLQLSSPGSDAVRLRIISKGVN